MIRILKKRILMMEGIVKIISDSNYSNEENASSKRAKWNKLKKFITLNKLRLRIFRLWSFLRVGGPWSWWSLSWRGWRRGWCPRRVRRGKLRRPLGGPERRRTGISGPVWTPGRFLWRVFGKEAFSTTSLWTSSIFWFLLRRRCLVWICGVSWHHQWLVRFFWRLLMPIIFLELFVQWIFLLFILFLPF